MLHEESGCRVRGGQGIDGGYRVRDGQFREPGTESWVDSVMRQGLSQGWAG